MSDRAPRVLQVVLSLDPGGTERLVVELVSRLNGDIPMAVCCLDGAGAWADQLRDLDVPITALERRPGFQPVLGKQVARAALQHRADVIHAHHYSPFVYSAISKLWNSRARVVFTEHGRLADQVPSGKRRLANRVLVKAAGDVVTVSQDLRGHLAAEGFPADSVRVIYNGIAVGPAPGCVERQQVRAELGVKDGTLVLGTIARLDPVKDLGSLITASSLLPRQQDVVLVVIGDGPERANLERLASGPDNRSRVVFLGQRDDARRWLAGCDVYVNSSTSEGVSLTILEAMAAALPIVATEVGGTPEVVTAECGRLVPSRNPRALAEAIGALAANASLRRQLGDAARTRVEQEFSIERMVSEYRALYQGSSAS